MDEQIPQVQHPEWQTRYLVILFAGFTLILLIGILNYLNVFPLSKLLPNYLGFLPHRVYEEPQKEKASSLRQSSAAFPSPSATFAYDAPKANTLLSKYLKDKIKSDYLPGKIEVKHKLIASGKQEGTDYEFGANWTINNTFFQSNFHYEIDTNNVSDIHFSVQPPDIKETVVNASLAKSLTSAYLKNIPESPKFNCGTFQATISFCENFQTTDLGMEGFGLVIGKAQPNNTVFIFSCFIPKDSRYFNTRTSCLKFNEKSK